MRELVLFCKSFRCDLDRCVALVESVRRHNPAQIPFHLAVPAADRSLFVDRLGTEGLTISTDEELLGRSVSQSWVSQQLVKLRFAGLGLAENTVWIDSDFLVIRDLQRDEFMAYDGVPYTVVFDVRRDPGQDCLLGDPAADPEYERMLGDVQGAFRRIRDYFGRRGPLFYYGAPVIGSTRVVRALERFVDARKLGFEGMLRLAPFEQNWYGEFLFAQRVIPVVPRGSLAFYFTRDREYERFIERGYTLAHLAERGYVAVNFAAKWMRAPGPAAPTPRAVVPPSGAPSAVAAAREATRDDKLDLGQPWTGTYHRVGWGHALEALEPLHAPGGVLLEGFVEKKFG